MKRLLLCLCAILLNACVEFHVLHDIPEVQPPDDLDGKPPVSVYLSDVSGPLVIDRQELIETLQRASKGHIAFTEAKEKAAYTLSASMYRYNSDNNYGSCFASFFTAGIFPCLSEKSIGFELTLNSLLDDSGRRSTRIVRKQDTYYANVILFPFFLGTLGSDSSANAFAPAMAATILQWTQK